ncbi:hypothetical protein [Lentzea sp. NEAU-D7]|uniref:golvesin C-terminal-like domain-containing protein n=1 Tax=Lentzea sp. NEAU-D7 TaxID=2994667 RepID=UPI00224B1C10|nr:hypothetical protein [Lentzea sp. NEAU-D7]MCX2948442.1 hypothetical protein [Lentzea sp. NEAU-D7]
MAIANVEEVSPKWWEGDDFVVTGRGDTHGYHVLIGLENRKYAFTPLASIQPGGYDGDQWLGYTCVTGDRSHVVVSVLPRGAVNRPTLRDRGASVYAIKIADGSVRPLASGVAFKQHAVGCGTGDQVAMLRHLEVDQAKTELLRGSASTAKVESVATVNTQLTWAVPNGPDRVMALRGSEIVTVSRKDQAPKVVGKAQGQAFKLLAAADDQADLLVLKDNQVAVERLAGGKLSEVGRGDVRKSALLQAVGGTNVSFGLANASSHVRNFPQPVVPKDAEGKGSPSHESPPQAVSTRGKIVLAPTKAKTGKPAADETAPAVTKRLFKADSGQMVHGSSPEGQAATTFTEMPASGQMVANAQTPTCGVPRNDPSRMAYGPTNNQVSWAVEMATRGALKGPNARPANYRGSGLPAYSPSIDFELAPIKPSGGSVPSAIMNGVLAQESAYRQASRRTLPGSGGNSVVSDYYGAHGGIDSINYAESDCGYGISQVTTGMRATDTSISPNGKAKIAIDYAENIVAGMGILIDKWNQLYTAGIRINDSNPQYAENWYLALWAYNSGIQPGPQFGNTTGCTPSPTCTDQFGNWGLGWTNNPRNNDYPPARDVFLRQTYADAEHPADWPYQERILGWAETPIKNFKGEDAYRPLEPVAGTGHAVTYPDWKSFCNSSNSCDPNQNAEGQGCLRADFRCWWHSSASPNNCQTNCAKSPYAHPADSREPAGENPWVPACDSNLGSKAIIVDNLNNPAQNAFCGTRNWSTAGTFNYTVGTNAGGDPIGAIDFHQVATGFGAHNYFAGNALANDPQHLVTGTWTPNNLPAGAYLVRAHIPVAGASAESATYRITTQNGEVKSRTINQHEHTNHWKTLGVFQLGANAKVVLNNVTERDTAGGVGTVSWDAMAFVPAPGRYEEHTVEAFAVFDEDTNIDTAPPASWVAGRMANRQSLYDWGTQVPAAILGKPACTSSPNSGCTTQSVRNVTQAWRDQVVAAGTDPVNHPDGNSITTWMAFANDYRDRPTSLTKPTRYGTDRDIHKIRSKATVSYVVDDAGKIIEGSADASYDHETGDTHLAKFMTDFFSAMQTDYGIRPPDMSYSARDLNVHNHQVTRVEPNRTGRTHGRAYAAGGTPSEVVDYNGNPVVGPGGTCATGRYISGGSKGFRSFLESDAAAAESDRWWEQIKNDPRVPDEVQNQAEEIFDVFLDQEDLVTGAEGSPFNGAPPLWQELNFKVCVDGSIRQMGPVWTMPILASSHMPDHYLYFDNRQINNDGSRSTVVGPVKKGNFYNFSKGLWEDSPFSSCVASGDPLDGRGNPWNIQATDSAGVNPSKVFYCGRPYGSPATEYTP